MKIKSLFENFRPKATIRQRVETIIKRIERVVDGDVKFEDKEALKGSIVGTPVENKFWVYKKENKIYFALEVKYSKQDEKQLDDLAGISFVVDNYVSGHEIIGEVDGKTVAIFDVMIGNIPSKLNKEETVDLSNI